MVRTRCEHGGGDDNRHEVLRRLCIAVGSLLQHSSAYRQAYVNAKGFSAEVCGQEWIGRHGGKFDPVATVQQYP